MMKLTRQIQKTVLENMKVLSQVETWQFAAICQADTEYSSVLQGTDYFRPSWTDADLLDGALDELYEIITMIVNESSGAIVAIRAKDLIRPIAEEGTVTEILQGLRSGSLWTIDCRRLRLFSSTNRLNHDQWHLLPRIQTVVEFCWTLPDNGEDSSPVLDTWHTRLLGKLQKQMQARFLAKESMQYVMKWVQDTNSPQQALVALEAFVLHHTPKKEARRGKVKG
ncbi:hypothetical protein Poli38472_011985 [Pythium oligandrum]|uniref:Uncharacterized protein n=1 Tax=Pythium oligandrum TaxID=41045 RepID=A0A8K1FN20_PYTOL|nr:hypothetical protein Poli38472_011985 [Pythium oligandrum]|eukprot:TMW66869.1 hypothetical protein Poli38472_011985 [Pythium oligandrum]